VLLKEFTPSVVPLASAKEGRQRVASIRQTPDWSSVLVLVLGVVVILLAVLLLLRRGRAWCSTCTKLSDCGHELQHSGTEIVPLCAGNGGGQLLQEHVVLHVEGTKEKKSRKKK